MDGSDEAQFQSCICLLSGGKGHGGDHMINYMVSTLNIEGLLATFVHAKGDNMGLVWTLT